MAKQKYFDEFLSNIEPSKTTIDYISSVQNNLRYYLEDHNSYKQIHVDTFLSGSYAKHTCIRPKLYDGKRDVDIVIETSYDSSVDSTKVLTELCDVLKERKIYDSAKIQSHSVGIEMSGIDIDISPVIKDTDTEKYRIGSSKENIWELTDPKGHIAWSSEVNAVNNQKYKPLVKMIKWWYRSNCPDDAKYPKGITLEKITADNLPDSDLNTENHLISAFQNIVSAYKEEYVDEGRNPQIKDPTNKENDLLASYTLGDFKKFILKIEEHLILINDKGTTNETWRKILGTDFPVEDSTSMSERNYLQSKAYTSLEVPHRQRPSWSIPRGFAAYVNAKVILPNGTTINIENGTNLLPKGCKIYYHAICGVKPPFTVKWQIVNTGADAASHSCLRGGFENSNDGQYVRIESTAFTGTHYVQCFILKNGQCVSKSAEFFINIQ